MNIFDSVNSQLKTMKRTYTLFFLLLLIFTGNQAFSQIKINEFDYDQPGTDTAEFIEIFNPSANAIDLSLYSVVLINGNNNNAIPYDTITLPSYSLLPGGFFVICGNGGHVTLCNMQLSDSANLIQNGSPDAIAIVETATWNIIDVVSYEGTVIAPYAEGTGVPTTQNDTSNAIYFGISRFPDGQDSNDNSADFQTACVTPGMPNVNVNTGCQQPLSVSYVPSVNALSIYPNPAKSWITVDFNGSLKNATVTINNVLGKEIKRVNLNGLESKFQFDLSDYRDGVYFIKVKSDSGEHTQRVILRK